jgi:hypothetical protein
VANKKNASDRQLAIPGLRNLMAEAMLRLELLVEEPLPPEHGDAGAGIYAIYYRGTDPLYKKLVPTKVPIYVGKAVLPGTRKAKAANETHQALVLRRLREHANSLSAAGFDLDDFTCKYLVLSKEDGSIIPGLESFLINAYQPLWNTVVDGFGNHDPGSGRDKQSKSEWDTLHPGRAWVLKLTGVPPDEGTITKKIRTYMRSLR